METKTRQTAARLDRFKKADHWELPLIDQDLPEPINLTPYYIAALVLCALLILDGFLTEFGFVDYSPILK